MTIIDTNFDVYSDTPKGRDPDSYSATLRKYHQILWSKPLPNGVMFGLEDNIPRLLQHKSELGEFLLSSDSIGHTYSKVKSMSPIVDQIPSEEIKAFFSVCSTVGAYIIFPAKKIDNKMTINGSRGLNRSIKDRFDLTLECIRRFYVNKESPLTETFQRYASFFNLFHDFGGYVDFFLLQDLVDDGYSVKFFLPFESFNQPPLPKNVEQYRSYKKHLIEFVSARNQRILNSTVTGT